jgi:chemotaxis protein MotB
MADNAPQASAAGPAVVIIKKKKGGEAAGHHGGAWKVAYADFVTAMMAFFLLLWLLSSTTEEQKEGIAHYFNPPNNSTEYGGGNGIMGGETAIATPGHAPLEAPVVAHEKEDEDLAVQATEDALFQQIAQQVKKEVMNIPELQMMMKNLIVEVTPEGLRIQLVDSKDRPLFAPGNAQMYDYTRHMLAVVASVLAKLPNGLAIGGHTDSAPYRGEKPAYTNWDLSSDRANAARRVMTDEGIPDRRIARVAGYAAQEPLLRDQPEDPKNRRLSIIVLRARKGPVAAFSQQGLSVPAITRPQIP